ncbi:SGNH/GDSL hydrolase family protein [Mesobacillus foraminis]|uniref:SGNH/GDSL hydrolase family protein n=1 Tax=Mesobacillus foraminis TaxID=279826 RepID=UPI00399FD68D
MGDKKHIVLFQGDSITDGARSRNQDPSHLLGDSYAFTIAGKLSYELAEKNPQFINRGVSGDRVSDLYARWNEDAISLQPSLISFLIGVNDAWRSMSNEPSGVTDRFERAYRHLLAETKEVLPETGLVICEPFILNTGSTVEKWDAWKMRLEQYQDIARNLSEEFGAVFVPLQKPFNEACKRQEPSYWLWDGVHPTPAGHELIAREWLNVVQNSKLAIR